MTANDGQVRDLTDDERRSLLARYRELQQYAGWTTSDAERVSRLSDLLTPIFSHLVDDFYEAINRHPQALRVITGGAAQIERLKGTLQAWLAELLSGADDEDYVARRWRVGRRHIEIGLEQVYTNVALSRLRHGLTSALAEGWPGTSDELAASLQSLQKRIDLELALIEDAYQSEHLRRQKVVERMAAIGQVAGGIAHELRNPLNVISTSVYYLLNARSAPPEKLKEHLQRIHKQVGLADSVITALSNFARLPLPSMQPFDVAILLQETLDTCAPPEGIAVTWAVPTELARPLGDPAQLRIVFGNLIRNAHDAMSGGGQLTIAGASNDDFVLVSVEDTGCGIAPEHLDRVMEPLFTTKARGIGLGLAISRAIILQHGGQISLNSRQGEGTTFQVKLPVARNS